MKPIYSRRNALRTLATAAPLMAIAPAAAQTPVDDELTAAEARLNASIETLRKFPLPADAESVAIFKV